jgi:hypothetical protein
MKLLFVTTEKEDYLSDSVFHGLRSLLGPDVVDFPRVNRMYLGLTDSEKQGIRGGGFTLYGLLPDERIDRFDIQKKLQMRHFDLIVIGSIWRDWQFFRRNARYMSCSGSALLDGEDIPRLYPAAGRWMRKPANWTVPGAGNRPYFKRELAEPSWPTGIRFLPEWIRNMVTQRPKRLFPLSFSIPGEKLATGRATKTSEFGRHVVDPEIAPLIPNAQESYPFKSEEDYYSDLMSARFAVTTKRAGWDCLRHYEIAANGTVPCFRNLHLKPSTCSPHGLTQHNCVSYSSLPDLVEKLAKVNDNDYETMRANALTWARKNTTVERAKELLSVIHPDSSQASRVIATAHRQ